jgi:soluble lytic murein transglycosylase
MSKGTDLPMSDPPEREPPPSEGLPGDVDLNEPVSSPASLRDFFASDAPPAPPTSGSSGVAPSPLEAHAIDASRPSSAPLDTEFDPRVFVQRSSDAGLRDRALPRGRSPLDEVPASHPVLLDLSALEPPLGEAPASEPLSERFVSEPASSDAPFFGPADAGRASSAPGLARASTSPQRGSAALGPAGAAPRRRRPWLLFAAAGVACFRLCGGEAAESPEARATLPAARKAASSSPLTFDVDGPFTTATLGSAAALFSAKSGAGSASPVLLDRSARKPNANGTVLGGAAKPEAEHVAKALAAFELTARPVVPGRTWQESANASDWPAVALSIDALPPAEKAQPGARYARARAARELGQCDVALPVLDGLESELPLLGAEIAELRAQCQLEVGPYEAAFEYFSEDQTPDNLTLAARAAMKEGDLAKAERTVEKALSKIRKQDGRRAQQREIAARIVRANILEERGQAKLAARDWLWLATEMPTDAASATADDTYERLAGTRLGSVQRLERLRAFAREGQLERSLREYARLAAAPGPAPDRVDVSSALAWAYYHSRTDYAKAGELFREAASLSPDTRAKFLFYEARALERANENELALDAYRDLMRRYPGGPYTEQAHYRLARIEYGRGRWEAAERAYTDYLDRYARNGGGKYASSSRYELAVARIGAKERTEEAAQTLGQLAKRERRASRRASLTELEAVALELTHEPAKVQEAIVKYRSVVDDHPLSFAARAAAARLRALGSVESSNVLGQLPAFDANLAEGRRLPEKAQFLADIGLHTDAELALFDARQADRERYSEGEGQTLCSMYGALDRGFRSYALAERLLKRDDLGRLPSANNVWAWRCKYPEPYRDIVGAVEARYHLPPSLVHAVMRQESGFRPNVVSPAGAIGLMQLMPNTAIRAAEEIMQQPGAPWVPDPRRPTNVLNNVELGGFYLSKLLSMLAGQLPVAVAAYNAGPGAVSSWLEGGEDLPIDVWVARIPFMETRDYVSIVVSNWLAYRYLDNPTELPELKLALVPGVRAAPDAY